MTPYLGKLSLQLQSFFWIVLIVFSTLGCSVKENMVYKTPVTSAKALSGSKATSSGLSCATILQARDHADKQIKKNTPNTLREFYPVSKDFRKDLLTGISKDYFLGISVNDPPLYLLFQKILIALFV